MPTTILLPDPLHDALAARIGGEAIAAWGIEAMAVVAARQGVISRRKAASLLGIDAGRERRSSRVTAWSWSTRLRMPTRIFAPLG